MKPGQADRESGVTLLKVLEVDIQSPCTGAVVFATPVAMPIFVTRILITVLVCNLPGDL
jgi:hypothetical protein